MSPRGASSSGRGVGFAGACVCAVLAPGIAACAGLVGANFTDEYLKTDAGPHGADGGGCSSGLTECTGGCVDLATSPTHCGRCDVSCPNDPNGTGVCVNTHCAFVCAQGWVECAGGCCDPMADAGSVPVVAGVLCGGGSHCSIASNSFCCGNGGSSDACDTDPDDPCDFELYCDDADDCPGQVCCFDPSMTGSGCQDRCFGDQTQMCDPNTSGECLAGTACTGSIAPTNTTYSTCE